jgi:hypothetical protein
VYLFIYLFIYLFFFPCSSFRDSNWVKKFTLADNFWFSLEVAGCQKTDQPTRTQLFICTKHTLCTIWGMPQIQHQLENHSLQHFGAISALTPALFLSLKLRASELCGLWKGLKDWCDILQNKCFHKLRLSHS